MKRISVYISNIFSRYAYSHTITINGSSRQSIAIFEQLSYTQSFENRSSDAMLTPGCVLCTV